MPRRILRRLNVILRVEAYRFQRRAERLMADVQALKLRKSNWLEAERLISRWGKYGNYEGHCDASFCRYSIGLESPGMALGNAGFWRYLNNRFVRLTAPFIFELLRRKISDPADNFRRTRERRLAEERSLHLRRSFYLFWFLWIFTHRYKPRYKPPYLRRLAAHRERAVSGASLLCLHKPGWLLFLFDGQRNIHARYS